MSKSRRNLNEYNEEILDVEESINKVCSGESPEAIAGKILKEDEYSPRRAFEPGPGSYGWLTGRYVEPGVPTPEDLDQFAAELRDWSTVLHQLVKDETEELPGVDYDDIYSAGDLLHQASDKIDRGVKGYFRAKKEALTTEAVSDKRKQKWMATFSAAVTAKKPEAAGKIDWDTATYFYNEGMDPTKAADKYIESGTYKHESPRPWRYKSVGESKDPITRIAEGEDPGAVTDEMMQAYEDDRYDERKEK